MEARVSADLVARILSSRPKECDGCGADRDLRCHLVVPIARGGAYKESNVRLLCPACLREAQVPRKDHTRKYVNVWVSATLYDRVQDVVAQGSIASINELVRTVVQRYAELPDAYEDLVLYQDEASEVKINTQVSAEHYERFRELVKGQRRTVQDVVRALLWHYVEEA